MGQISLALSIFLQKWGISLDQGLDRPGEGREGDGREGNVAILLKSLTLIVRGANIQGTQRENMGR